MVKPVFFDTGMDLSSTAVALTSCRTYDQRLLDESFERMWTACSIPLNLKGLHVLLKPNLISARHGLLACTQGEFILAATHWFLARGSRVSIGDSPAFGTAGPVLARIGIREELQSLGVRICDFRKKRDLVLPSGIRAGFAADALECDLLVNLPRIKAHTQLRVTMAVKNYFGCIVGMQKPVWHMIYGGCPGRFESHIVELLSELPDSISIVDGITAMHENGPIRGKAFPLGLTACAASPVALDRALLEVIGIDPALSPIMQECLRAGLPGAKLADVDFPLMQPGEFSVDEFAVPVELSPVRFNPFRFGRSSLRRMLLAMRRT